MRLPSKVEIERKRRKAYTEGYDVGCTSAVWFREIPRKINIPSPYKEEGDAYLLGFTSGFMMKRKKMNEALSNDQ